MAVRVFSPCRLKSFPPESISHQDAGQGLVEFVLVLFLLLILAFGVLDFGRMFNTLVVLTNAAREGARYGSRFPDDSNGMVQAALDEAQSTGISLSASDVTVFCTDLDNPNDGCDRGFPVVVTVSHSFEFFFGSLFSTNPVPLSRSAQMIVP